MGTLHHKRAPSASGGYSLIELMVALAVSGVLILAVGEMFGLNEKASAKNNMRFKMEDSVRFAIDTLNETIAMAGHTFCAELRDYSPITSGDGEYADGDGLLYQSHSATNPMTKIQGYDGDTGAILTAANWSPDLAGGDLPANNFGMDGSMDALVVRSLGKHLYRLKPAANASSNAGGATCASLSAFKCNFEIFIENPLIDSTISFNSDPIFFDISYRSGLASDGAFGESHKFPIALTNCANANQMVLSGYKNTRTGLVTGTEVVNFTTNTTVTGFSPPYVGVTNPRVFAQGANIDLIFVDDDGILRRTRPGHIVGSDPAAVGLSSQLLLSEPTGARGDIIVTGFRALYGITTAAGLPRGFVRPGSIADAGAWETVKLVRYALAVEIVDYYEKNRNLAATNLLDKAIATQSTKNFRRIYEQIVFINN